MNYLSLFDGIGAATVAWRTLGWVCKGKAEIEPFPSAVTDHHFPGVPNLGDVTKITDEMVAALGPLDVVVGGSPCQDLSVAGKRAGLEGMRSGLFHEHVRIFHAARLLCGARYLLWENVPGAFSTNDGRDFALVVGAMAGTEFGVPSGGWQNTGVAIGPNGLVEWCVLDAQYLGVPQRRRRVFALLDTGDWHGRPPILFEPESLRGDPPPSRQPGERSAPCLAARTSGGGGLGTDFDTGGGRVHHLNDEPAHSLRAQASHRADSETYVPVVAGCLNSVGGHAVPGNSVQDADQGYLISILPPQREIAPALTGNYGKQPDNSDTSEGPMLVHCMSSGQANAELAVERRTTLNCLHEAPIIAFKASHFTRGKDGAPSEIAPPLSADADKGDQDTLVAIPHVDRMPTLRPGASASGAGHGARSGDSKDEYIVPVMTLASRGRDGGHNLEVRTDGTANAVLTPSGGRGGIGVGAVAFAQNSRDEVRLEGGDGGLCGERAAQPGAKQQTYVAIDYANGGDAESSSSRGQTTTADRTRGAPLVGSGMQVRRLTPLECERLQAFPDGFTAIVFRRKPAADGPRYKALGNSMHTGTMLWIGKRIAAVPR